MSDHLLANIVQAIAPQTTVNIPTVDPADFNGFLSDVEVPKIPVLETVDDSQHVGDGFSRVERNIRNYYWQNGQFKISGLLNDHIAPVLINAHQGGAVTVTNRTTPSKDIASVMNVSNSNPKLFSLYRHNGGEQFIHSDLAPDTWEIDQQSEARPTYNVGLLSTGHHLDPDEIAALDDPEWDDGDIIVVPAYEEFHGAATEITATDGINTYNWTQDGTLISVNIQSGNSVQVSRRPGDTFKGTTRKAGAFARKIRNGASTGAIKLKVDLGSDLLLFKAMVAGRKLTGLTVVFNGFDKISPTTDDFEFEVKAPLAGFQMIEGDSDQDHGALALNITPLRDAVTKGRFTVRTRTGLTLF
jgi:hypothetical protein